MTLVEPLEQEPALGPVLDKYPRIEDFKHETPEEYQQCLELLQARHPEAIVQSWDAFHVIVDTSGNAHSDEVSFMRVKVHGMDEKGLWIKEIDIDDFRRPLSEEAITVFGKRAEFNAAGLKDHPVGKWMIQGVKYSRRIRVIVC